MPSEALEMEREVIKHPTLKLIPAFIMLLILVFFLGGCARDVPLQRDTLSQKPLPVKEKIYLRVGVFVDENVQNYVHTKDRLGIAYRMPVGRNVAPLAMLAASALFDEAVEVHGRPPYTTSYQPDVQAVVEVELLSVHLEAVGTLAGHIEAQIGLRLKVINLRGDVLWNHDAWGEGRSEGVDFVNSLLKNRKEVHHTVQEAGLSSIRQILRDFNPNRVPELQSFAQLRRLSPGKSSRNVSDASRAENLFQKGMEHLKKKNFHEALYAFQMAERSDPNDLLSRFYTGVCYVFTGQRDRALLRITGVLDNKPRRPPGLAADCRKWIDRLHDPLKIMLVGTSQSESLSPEQVIKEVSLSLSESKMYEIVALDDFDSSGAVRSVNQRNEHLSRAVKAGAKVLLMLHVVEERQDVRLTGEDTKGGDSAVVLQIKTIATAYGTESGKLIAELRIEDSTSTMGRTSFFRADKAEIALMGRSGDRLLLNLLKNEIF